MADSDGQVVIDLSLRRDGIQSDIEWLKSNLKNLGADVDADQISEKFENAMNKTKHTVNEAVESINDKKANPKISADDSRLKEKAEESTEKIEKLNGKHAKAKISADNTNLDEKVSESREELNKIPKNKRTIITVDDEASEPTRRIGSSFKESTEKSKGFIETLKGTAVGMGIYNAAMRVGSTVSNEFVGAINRYDTLNNYPKVLESMGISAKDANDSIKILKNGVDGLPTSLDDVANVAKRLIPMSKNADDAAKSALALNDAFLASGASSEDASRGLIQYTQMLSSGKVDMMSWRTLEETMPASLQKLAKSFGITSGSAQVLYKQLSTGKITMRELNDHLQQLDKGANGFHQTALMTTAGIGTAFKNLGNRAKAAMQEAISGFDSLVKSLTGKSIAQNINQLSSRFSNFGKEASVAFKNIANYIKPLVPAFSALGSIISSVFKGAIQPIKDAGSALSNMFKQAKNSGAFTSVSKALQDIAKNKTALEGVGKAVAGMIAAFAGAKVLGSTFAIITKGISTFVTLGKTISNIKSLAGALSILQFGLKGLVSALGGIPGLIAITVGAFVALYNVNPKFHKFINGIVSDVKSFSKKFVKGFKDAFDNVGKFFTGKLTWEKNLIKSLKKIGKSISKTVKGWGKDIKKGFKAIEKVIAKAVAPWIKPIVTAFKKMKAIVSPDLAKFRKSIDKHFRLLGKSADKANKKLTKANVKMARSARKATDKISKNISEFTSWVNKHIGKFINKLNKDINKGLRKISNFWNSSWKKLQKMVMLIFNAISKFVNGHMKQIKSIINSGLNVIHTIWNGIWQQIANEFKLVWDLIFHRSRVIKDIRNIISTEIRIIKSIWQNIWNIIKNYFDMVWDAIKNIARSAVNWVRNVIESTIGAIQSTWNKIWSAIEDFVDNIWDGIKKIVSNGINSVHDTISSVLSRTSDVWHSMWTSFSDFFKSIWKGIKESAADGINGVLSVINAGIDGIDAVWKFFTGHETSIHHLRPVHFAQGGIVDRHLSMVNDGDGEDWKELIETPDGDLMMSDKRNAILPLEPGTRVYNGAETRQIMSMLGVDHYANGGIVGGVKHYKDGGVVGDLIDWGAHELKDFGSWIKDKWDAITKFLKHPLENTKAIIKKAITRPLSKLSNPNMVALGKGVFDKLTKPISDWFKKGLEEAKKKHDEESVGGFGNIKDMKNSAELRDLVKAALEANGLSTSDDMIAKVMRQIATESGGNAHAVQPGADPDGDGSGPALGLMQTKRSTFNAYKAPGHDDIFNAYDNLLAALNYAKHRYGPSLYFLGQGHGYDNGGAVDNKQLAWIAEKNREYVINPQRASADELLMRAAEERAAYDPNSEIAKAISGMNMARQSNGAIVPNVTQISNAYTSSNSANVSPVQDNRPVNISVELDGRTIANASYPYQKMLQASDIRIQARKGGGAFA